MSLVTPFITRAMAGALGTGPKGNYVADSPPQDVMDGVHTNIFQRLLDPTFVQMKYNTAERIATERFNAEQAKIQRDWEASMANSAYQRAKNDLEAAGLNPYLAYNQGGAATPTGQAAHMNNSAYITGQSTSQVWQGILSLMVNTALGVARMNDTMMLNSLKMDNALAKSVEHEAQEAYVPNFTYPESFDPERHSWVTKFPKSFWKGKQVSQMENGEDPREDRVIWYDKDGRHYVYHPEYEKYITDWGFKHMNDKIHDDYDGNDSDFPYEHRYWK